MTKLNSTIYNKLLLQAQEAKDQGMVKLASSVLNCIGALPEEDKVQYSLYNLESDVHKEMWKVAASVLKYHDLTSVDIERLDSVIESFASKFVVELEENLGVESLIGKLEEKLPGQN